MNKEMTKTFTFNMRITNTGLPDSQTHRISSNPENAIAIVKEILVHSLFNGVGNAKVWIGGKHDDDNPLLQFTISINPALFGNDEPVYIFPDVSGKPDGTVSTSQSDLLNYLEATINGNHLYDQVKGLEVLSSEPIKSALRYLESEGIAICDVSSGWSQMKLVVFMNRMLTDKQRIYIKNHFPELIYTLSQEANSEAPSEAFCSLETMECIRLPFFEPNL